jgi:hypothetical protein
MGVKIGSRRKLLAYLAATPANPVQALKSWEIPYAELQLTQEAGEGFYGAVYADCRISGHVFYNFTQIQGQVEQCRSGYQEDLPWQNTEPRQVAAGGRVS